MPAATRIPAPIDLPAEAHGMTLAHQEICRIRLPMDWVDPAVHRLTVQREAVPGPGVPLE